MLSSGLPDHVADAEPLSRFITSDSQFNNAMPKASAFMPGPVDAKTSVFRQGADPLPALWEMADREIGVARRVRAVAVLTAADVRQATLEVEAREPPPKHANIIGWPSATHDPELSRAQRKDLALLLVQSATLIRR